MNIIDFINNAVDPFIMQIIIVPIISIGVGILISVYTKIAIAAPVITLLINLVYENYFLKLFRDKFYLSQWSIFLPILSLILSLVIIYLLKRK
ncbi:hypothetical protein CHL78_002100 [Romboutsia weinsteinii]|uniref:LptF/LptG family permease n=1 Tax=Romboutsia weinsteinii TaxID=2020949 RepID=A0A371J8L5_9FIRM|nr:hypothetical protein [Romboutsia weinsteinii]RDY29120.1 hypothetical protein CHL78_002100 [Romboutsia weinsteinii]